MFGVCACVAVRISPIAVGYLPSAMTERYYAAACQTAFDSPKHRDEIPSRVDRMLAIAEQTIVGYEPFFDVRLLAFPCGTTG